MNIKKKSPTKEEVKKATGKFLNFCPVISIENGTIVEDGTPQELLSQKGMFFNLWNIQNEALKLKK